MTTLLRVLILEDSPTGAEVMLHHLREAGYSPDWRRVETEADFCAHLDPTLDLIHADYTLPDFTARQALHLLRGPARRGDHGPRDARDNRVGRGSRGQSAVPQPSGAPPHRVGGWDHDGRSKG